MATTTSSPSPSPPKLFRLLSSERPDWGAVIARLRLRPEEASFVDGAASQTALHLVLASSSLPSEAGHDRKKNGDDDDEDDDDERARWHEQRRAVIRTLLALFPEATSRRCRGDTPLAAACRTSSLETVHEDAKVVKILVLANPRPINVPCDDGLTPLILHIKSISRLMFEEDARTTLGVRDPKPVNSAANTTTTAVLDVLARHSNREQLEQAIEALYQCNTLATMDLVSREEANARKDRRVFGLKEPRPSATLAGHWIWEMLLVLLRHVSNRLGDRPRASRAAADFFPLHVASQVAGCPPPFVLLAMRAFPQDVRTVLDGTTGDLPSHRVATWTRSRVGSEEAGAPGTAERERAAVASSSTRCRQSMCLTELDSAHPLGMHAPNSQGKTPLDLEAESERGGAILLAEQPVV